MNKIPPYQVFQKIGDRHITLIQQNAASTLNPIVQTLNQSGQFLLSSKIISYANNSASTLPANSTVSIAHNFGRAAVGILPLIGTNVNPGWLLANTPTGGNTKLYIYLTQTAGIPSGQSFSFLVF